MLTRLDVVDVVNADMVCYIDMVAVMMLGIYMWMTRQRDTEIIIVHIDNGDMDGCCT